MEHFYGIIGNFRMDTDRARGLTVCGYSPETGDLTVLENVCPEMNIGWQAYDPVRNMVYVTDEQWSQPGRTGGGGNVAPLKLDPSTGKLELTSCRRTLGVNPCCLCLDENRNFLIVVHHTTEHFVTRVVRKPDGTPETETLYDACTMVLYALEEDGRIGQICDVVTISGEDRADGHRWPHLHAVVRAPFGGYFVVNDKGLRKIYVYTIDTDRKKLVLVSRTDAPEEGESRYGVFDRKTGVCYVNFENRSFLCAYAVHPEKGSLTLLNRAELHSELGQDPRPSDIVLHPSGRWLYVALRTTNEVAVLALDRKGGMRQIQAVSCGGAGPRGLCLDPDGKRLFSLNGFSGDVSAFAVAEDGCLRPLGTGLYGRRSGKYADRKGLTEDAIGKTIFK